MTELLIAPELAQQLEEIAGREQLTVTDLLRTMIEVYETRPTDADDEAVQDDPLENFIGAFHDDVTDLSTTVRETMDAFYREKYGRPD